MVQLALLGQTFGMLSGVSDYVARSSTCLLKMIQEPRHLAIVSAFHGTVISVRMVARAPRFQC